MRAGNDRLYSPLLHGVVELLPGDVASTVKLTPEMYSRAVASGGKNRGMSVRAMIDKTFSLAVKHQLKRVSDKVTTPGDWVHMARSGAHRR